MDYQVFCIIVFTLDEIQLLAAQPRLDLLGRGEVKGWRKKRSGGRGNELFGSSCFGCCFCFPALYSAASPILITFNITLIFIIYSVLMSSSPDLKPATFWERILFHFSLPQKSFLSSKVLPNSWPKRWNIANIMSWSYQQVSCQLSALGEHTTCLWILFSYLGFS